MPRYRIVLVEPNAELAKILRDYLARSDFDAATAPDAQQALELARRERPDLVLAERELPGADGLQLARALRAEAGLETTPLVLLVAGAGPEQRLDCLDAGADDYVLKPFTMRELVARCRRLIDAHRRKDPGELAGDLSRVKITDILQLLEANQATGVLHVEGRGAEPSGEIHLLDGYICGGFAAHLRGEGAVFRLIPVRQGRFHFLHTNIHSNIQSLRSTTEFMMEALRRHDEKEHYPS